ncbi:protein of unknown function [Candidatus Promineifilum breve]|uniref:Uncharacterized protein n=1 Tax=Candidatus Promineifilum breve TaxID=1806508 RepID=A0A160T799_9CHLR|nr:protein of unknown function [Candidatus Promineifilum breve]
MWIDDVSLFLLNSLETEIFPENSVSFFPINKSWLRITTEETDIPLVFPFFTRILRLNP